jgi:hypothetical protein
MRNQHSMTLKIRTGMFIRATHSVRINMQVWDHLSRDVFQHVFDDDCNPDWSTIHRPIRSNA